MKLIKKFTVKPNFGILNEFYTKDGQMKKGLRFKEYKDKVLYRFQKVVENRGVLYTNDEHGLLKHMLIEIIVKKLKKLKIKTFANIKNKFKAWMKIKDFKELFYVVVTLIFSCEFSEISDMLSIKCCSNERHYGFCKEKWEELWKFTQAEFLKNMKIAAVNDIAVDITPYSYEELDSLFIN